MKHQLPNFCRLSSRKSPVRRGLSLIEVLIALTMTLIVLGAMIAVFSRASKEMSRKRAMIEMHNLVRPCVELLRSDLEQVTVPVRPASIESGPSGYFEIIEGPRNETSDYALPAVAGMPMQTVAESIRGDFDDILAMTVRSSDKPFLGRWVDGAGQTQVIESHLAEIVWYTDYDDREPVGQPGSGVVGINERITVYRRVLLIRPDLVANPAFVPALNVMPGTGTGIAPLPSPAVSFFLQNDISASFASGVPVPNSLEDLSKRENRFGHSTAGYPYAMDRDFLRAVEMNDANLSIIGNAVTPNPDPRIRQFAGNDVVLRGAMAFDLKVWSPDTPVRQANPGNLSTALTMPDHVLVRPGDPAYLALGPAVYPDPNPNPDPNAVATGAYVDLGYMATVLASQGVVNFQYTGTAANVMNGPQFSTTPNPKSGLRYLFDPPGFGAANLEPPVNPPAPGIGPLFDNVWDTFSAHYETNGIDDDGNGLIDEGADGLDNDSANGVDDVQEREVEPPFPFEVRGVQVTIRMVHPESAQVHQTSVVQSFARK